MALASAKALKLPIAGVDLLFDNDSHSICEVNSAPGFQGFEAATGLNVARSVLQLCQERSRPVIGPNGHNPNWAGASTLLAASA